MRPAKSLIVGLAAACLVGCGSQGRAGQSPALASGGNAAARPYAASARPASPQTKAAARAAAADFYREYFKRRFTIAWQLLAPKARHQIPTAVWVSVHEACPPTAAPSAKQITSVTVFGDAAIITSTINGTHTPMTAADIFNYANHRWGYSPSDISIYHHGSVDADIAAARAAGLCRSKAF